MATSTSLLNFKEVEENKVYKALQYQMPQLKYHKLVIGEYALQSHKNPLTGVLDIAVMDKEKIIHRLSIPEDVLAQALIIDTCLRKSATRPAASRCTKLMRPSVVSTIGASISASPLPKS